MRSNDKAAKLSIINDAFYKMEEASFEQQFGSLLEEPPFQFSGLNHTAPFQTSVNNFLSRQLYEIRATSSTAPSDLSKSWKRRLREFAARSTRSLANEGAGGLEALRCCVYFGCKFRWLATDRS